MQVHFRIIIRCILFLLLCTYFWSDRTFFRREASLSEVRRLKLVSSGTATQLDRIAMELLETERSYVNDLNDVIQVCVLSAKLGWYMPLPAWPEDGKTKMSNYCEGKIENPCVRVLCTPFGRGG